MSHRPLPRLLSCLLLVALSAAVPAQTDTAILDSGLTEDVSVYLVEMNILATDKKGDPIRDLRPEDLVIKENGVEQRIAVFERHRRGPSTAPVPDARIHFNAPDGRLPRQTGGREPRWFVFFFDLVHGDMRTRIQLQQAAREFVSTRLPDDDLVAVASFDGEVHLEQNFTDDRGAIAAAIETAFARPARPLAWEQRMRELLTVIDGCQDQMAAQQRYAAGRDCVTSAARAYIREVDPTTRDFVRSVDTIARLLSGVQGRKYLLLFSHGVSLDPSYEVVEAVEAHAGVNWQLSELRWDMADEVDYQREFYAMIERAVRGDVVIFTLDGSPQPTTDFDLQNRGRFRRDARPYATAFEMARDGLDELATSTGGEFFGSSDFTTNLDRALLVTEGAYSVGYYTDLGRVENFREFVKVAVKSRRKGVRISSRRGFYFQPRSGTADLASLDLGTEELRGGRRVVPFGVTLDPRNFEMIKTDEEVGVNFTLHLRLLTEDGRSVADSFHFLSHAYAREIYDEGRIIAPRYEGLLELSPGDYLFNVVVRDPQSFAYAEMVQPLHVTAADAADETRD